MQIALYLKHFPAGSPANDGTSVAVAGLASGLARNGAQVTVLCEGPQGCSSDGGDYAVECFDNRASRHRFALAPGLKRYVAERLSPRRSLCLVNGMFHPSVYALCRWLRHHGVPYVLAPHDPYDAAVFRRNPHLKWPYWFLFERRLIEGACAVQVLDERHGDCLRHLRIGTRIIETENGVIPERVPAESKLQWRAPDAPVQLVFLGRLDAYNKGLDILLEAFAHLGAGPGVRLTLQGPDWGDRARLEHRARRAGIAPRVAFRDPDYGRMSPEILGEHDVFCLPSRFEGFGLAALEAMLAARVLIVSERAGIARHVVASGCGIAVPPTAGGVLAGLRTLLRHKDHWRAMGLRGRHYALQNLRWERIAATLLREYERLVI